jgi:uncharacterized protein with HEPN domain
MRDARLYLQDILSAIQQIQKHGGKTRAEFDADEFLQVWMVHHIQIIGEAVQRLPQDFRANNV